MAAAQPIMPPPPPPPAPAMAPTDIPTQRPTGVTILAVLNAIGAVLMVFAALAAFAFSGMGAMAGDGGGMFAMFGAAAGVLLLVMAAIYAAAAFGLWTRQRWGWYLGMAGVALGILNGLFSLPSGILGILISGLVGWYLLTPPVQAWFGMSYDVPWNKKTAA